MLALSYALWVVLFGCIGGFDWCVFVCMMLDGGMGARLVFCIVAGGAVTFIGILSFRIVGLVLLLTR